jgi:hypothetical protein
MSEYEIHIIYDPQQAPNVWKISFSDSNDCIRVWKKRWALRCARRTVRENRPCRLIIHNQNGDIEKEIKYSYYDNDNLSNEIKRFLFELTTVDLSFIAWLILGLVIILVWMGWFIWAITFLPLFKLYEYLKERINTIPPIEISLKKMRGGYSATQKTRLSKPPGTHLLALVDFLFSPKTVELTFKPLVADWRNEYFEALRQGRTLKAHWISVRYRVRFACVFVMSSGLSNVFSVFKQIK